MGKDGSSRKPMPMNELILSCVATQAKFWLADADPVAALRFFVWEETQKEDQSRKINPFARLSQATTNEQTNERKMKGLTLFLLGAAFLPQGESFTLYALSSKAAPPTKISGTAATAAAATAPTTIVSPVLKNVYPDLLLHIEKYQHPNIPLGNAAGRHCLTLRRLHSQQKLCESDIALLDTLHFTWHSLEDVYELQKDDFDAFLGRLLEYGGDFSPPKKYAADPELGAWVTALRRLKKQGRVDSTHIQQLEEATNHSFSWISPRVCQSEFMKSYRAYKEQQDRLASPDFAAFVRAQQAQYETLSQTRRSYMAELCGGEDWREWTPSSDEAKRGSV